ncbi:OmpA family protein [PVC group bacterium]|nr:OmpA family protein [PVC group bacterium]
MRTKIITTVVTFSLIAVAATGCVRHDRYDSMREATNSLKEQLVRSETDCTAATTALETRDQQLAQAQANLNALQDQYDLLAGELDTIAANNDDLLTRVTGIKLGSLPIETQQKLAALASTFPNDMWFDADSGMLRFGSDFTFSSGQAQLRKSAEELIARVATILNSNEAANFEIVVVGHTDNVQPTSSSIRYPSNWELSTARAVSVAKALAANGTDPSRFQVAGFGEFRPLVPNLEGGTKENRRVEIYLQPMTETITWETNEVVETVTVDTTEEPRKGPPCSPCTHVWVSLLRNSSTGSCYCGAGVFLCHLQCAFVNSQLLFLPLSTIRQTRHYKDQTLISTILLLLLASHGTNLILHLAETKSHFAVHFYHDQIGVRSLIIAPFKVN